jgi:hypothetical protein
MELVSLLRLLFARNRDEKTRRKLGRGWSYGVDGRIIKKNLTELYHSLESREIKMRSSDDLSA